MRRQLSTTTSCCILWVLVATSFLPSFVTPVQALSVSGKSNSRSVSIFSGIFALPSSNQNRENTNTRIPEISEKQVTLSDGTLGQVLISLPLSSKPKYPPILFLHGSFHAAWCWSEHYMQHFASLGYPVVAFSWRGTGGTPAAEGQTKVQAGQHGQDLQSVLDALPRLLGYPKEKEIKPILVSHSFGGIVVMKYLEGLYEEEADNSKPSDLFSGIVSMCSVPPSGNGKMTMRFLKRSLVDSYKITVGFAAKKAITDANLCRELFFGGTKKAQEDGTIQDYGVSDEDLTRYQSYFKRDTVATIDLLDLAKKLPSKHVDGEGRAPFAGDMPPCLVLGGSDDFIVDLEGNTETAKYYGLEAPLIVDSPHDIMLGAKWRNAADALHEWIQSKVVGDTTTRATDNNTLHLSATVFSICLLLYLIITT